MEHGVKIGLYESLTTMPLVYGMEALRGRAVLDYDTPLNLFEKLQTQKLDMALLPPYALFKNPKYPVIPKVAVVTENAAFTFKLYAKNLPDLIYNVLVDPRAALEIDFLNLMIPKLLMLHPTLTISEFPIRPNFNFAKSKYDAFLLYEEDAINCDYNFMMSWDIGESWRRYFNLPLVRYIFLVQPNLYLNKLEEYLFKIAMYGQKSINEIINFSQKKYHVNQDILTDFYQKDLKLFLDAKGIGSIKTLNREMVTAELMKGQIPIKMYQ